MGGESDILEGDESQFGKCKYSRGSRKNRRRAWVFGMISRTTKRLFLYVCPQDAAVQVQVHASRFNPDDFGKRQTGHYVVHGWMEGRHV